MTDAPVSDAATVFVVDDSISVRDSLAFLFRTVKLGVETYAAPSELLARQLPDGPGCVIVDVRMPEMGGLDLVTALRERGWRTPVVFISAHATVPTAVRAMQAGAVDFLEKPVDDERLLDRIQHAIADDRKRLAGVDDLRRRRARYASLTPREREVLLLLIEGHPNKEIAAHLAIRPKTVERHRASLKAKMRTGSLAELVAQAVRDGIGGNPPD
jgi:two-component system response regulator FixJ